MSAGLPSLREFRDPEVRVRERMQEEKAGKAEVGAARAASGRW